MTKAIGAIVVRCITQTKQHYLKLKHLALLVFREETLSILPAIHLSIHFSTAYATQGHGEHGAHTRQTRQRGHRG